MLLRWTFGFAAATTLMWAGSWPFLDSIMEYAHDPVVGRTLPAAGHVHRHVFVWGVWLCGHRAHQASAAAQPRPWAG